MVPEIKIIKASETSIYIRNILSWAKNNPSIAGALQLPFDQLVTGIDQSTASFRPIFEKNKELILKKISEISGFEWSIDNALICVYPTAFFHSFSHPLFLKVCQVRDGKVVTRSVGQILGTLIHELCHNNFRGLPVQRNTNETLIHFIVVKILNEINPVYAQEYLEFYEKLETKINFENIPLSIKDGKDTLKGFYSNKKE